MAAPSAGTRLGPYELLEPIGSGGMGEVWKARDTRLDRLVAVKFSHAQFSDRFKREAHTIAALNHPHICTLYDVGPDFLVMEYVEGAPLAGPLPLQDGLRLAAQITDALDAAHRKGIVHRDLKPANILVTKSGVKLLDFGLAKQAQRPISDSNETVLEAITGAGALVGTLQYMSPEKVEGKEADVRSDLFAFGCVLYETITGRRAFDGPSAASVIASILTAEPPPLTAVQPVTPPALDRLIQRCLAKDPETRWQCARDLRAELEWIATAPAETARPVATRSARFPIAVGLALAVGLFAGWLAHRPPAMPGAPVVRFGLTPPSPSYPAISPDGRHISYLAGKEQTLWIQDLDRDEPREMPGTAGAQRPFWSPDGRFVAFVLRGELVKLSIAGGFSVPICQLPSSAFFSGAWSPDGEWIVFGDRGTAPGLYQVAARGGTPKLVVPDTADLRGPRDPSFLPLPQGRRVILFAAGDGRGTRTYVRDLKTNQQHPLGGADGQFPTFAKSGFVLYQRVLLPGVQLWAAPFSLETLKLTGESFPVADSMFVFGASKDDTLVYLERGPRMRQLHYRDRAGRDSGQIGTPEEEMYSPALSPDGRRIAVVAGAGSSRNIWIHEVSRPVRTRITFYGPDQNGYPYSLVWSPRGDRIAFSSSRPGGSAIVTRSVDGSGKDVELLGGTDYPSVCDWSPDGRLLIFDERTPSQRRRISWLNVAESHPKQEGAASPELPYSEYSAKLSPDGRLLAYSGSESGRFEVYIRRFPDGGGKQQISAGGGSNPRWRRDGRELFYMEDKTIVAVSLTPGPEGLTIGTPQKLFSLDSGGGYTTPYDVSADGKQFITTEAVGDSRPPAIRVVQNWSAPFRDRRGDSR